MPPRPLKRYIMKFWKKVLKKFKKEKEQDLKSLIENKYFHRLQKKIDKLDHKKKKKK